MGVVVLDHFTDSNGTNLTAHTPDLVVSGGWTVGSGTYEIEGNQCQHITGGHDVALIESGVSDCTVSCTLIFASGSYNGLVGRGQDFNNFWYCLFDQSGTQIDLYECVASGFTLKTSASVSISNGAHLAQFVFAGASIQLWLDGVLQVSYTSSDFQSATKHGLDMFSVNQLGDDFSVSVATTASLFTIAGSAIAQFQSASIYNCLGTSTATWQACSVFSCNGSTVFVPRSASVFQIGGNSTLLGQSAAKFTIGGTCSVSFTVPSNSTLIGNGFFQIQDDGLLFFVQDDGLIFVG